MPEAIKQETRERRDSHDSSGWHLDRKVPITIILAMVFQTILAIYIGTTWKTEVDFRLANVERSITERQSQESRIITMEQQLRYIVESLQRIEGRIERRENGQ